MRLRAAWATLFGWLAAIGIDFFLHAGLLADVYARKSPFVLPLGTAFERLPYGYLAILMVVGYLVWAIQQTGAASLAGGLYSGLKLGVIVFGAFIMGLFSVSSIPLDLALAWFAAQSVELAVSGAVIGWTLSATRLFGPGVLTGALVVFGVIGALVLQNL